MVGVSVFCGCLDVTTREIKNINSLCARRLYLNIEYIVDHAHGEMERVKETELLRSETDILSGNHKISDVLWNPDFVIVFLQARTTSQYCEPDECSPCFDFCFLTFISVPLIQTL
jgi:hypothetical protein